MFEKTHVAGTPRLLAGIDRALLLITLCIGGSVLAMITLLSVVNVLIMRKALNAPIRGAEDVTVLALVAVVAIAIPFGARAGAHIEIELVDDLISPRLRTGAYAAMKLIAAAMMAVLAWQLWQAGGDAARFGESSATLIIPFGPFYYLLALSSAAYAALLVLELSYLARRRSYGGLDASSGGDA